MNKLTIQIDGRSYEAVRGMTVATALLANGINASRVSVSGERRAPFCGMGICYECRVRINDIEGAKSCQTYVAQGMKIETDASI